MNVIGRLQVWQGGNEEALRVFWDRRTDFSPFWFQGGQHRYTLCRAKVTVEVRSRHHFEGFFGRDCRRAPSRGAAHRTRCKFTPGKHSSVANFPFPLAPGIHRKRNVSTVEWHRLMPVYGSFGNRPQVSDGPENGAVQRRRRHEHWALAGTDPRESEDGECCGSIV